MRLLELIKITAYPGSVKGYKEFVETTIKAVIKALTAALIVASTNSSNLNLK